MGHLVLAYIAALRVSMSDFKKKFKYLFHNFLLEANIAASQNYTFVMDFSPLCMSWHDYIFNVFSQNYFSQVILICIFTVTNLLNKYTRIHPIKYEPYPSPEIILALKRLYKDALKSIK